MNDWELGERSAIERGMRTYHWAPAAAQFVFIYPPCLYAKSDKSEFGRF